MAPTLKLTCPCGSHGLAQKPTRQCGPPMWAHTPVWLTRPNLVKLGWLTRPHLGHHTVMSCARPSLRRSHSRVVTHNLPHSRVASIM
ncbi:hypothetical protein J1N35_028973, partial [Gossypium stocksii]